MRSNLGRSFRSDGWKLIPPGIKKTGAGPKTRAFPFLLPQTAARPPLQHAPPSCSPRAGVAPPPPHGLHQVVTGHIGPTPATWGSSAAAGPRSAGRRLLMRRCCMCHARAGRASATSAARSTEDCTGRRCSLMQRVSALGAAPAVAAA